VDLLAEPNARCAACHTLAGGWSAPGGRRRAARSPAREAHPRSSRLLERDLQQLCLLRRDLLSALCAFVAVEELGEVLGLVGVDPDDDPGLTPRAP